MKLYKREFPDYDDVLLIPKGYEDCSYHNDICPRVGKVYEIDGTEIQIYIWEDYKNPINREYEDTKRYVFQILSNGIYIYNFTTDDWNEILKTISGVML